MGLFQTVFVKIEHERSKNKINIERHLTLLLVFDMFFGVYVHKPKPDFLLSRNKNPHY
jgi:hypothetical protein